MLLQVQRPLILSGVAYLGLKKASMLALVALMGVFSMTSDSGSICYGILPLSRYFGTTPLMIAANQRRQEVLEALLSTNADVNLANRLGWSPLSAVHAAIGSAAPMCMRHWPSLSLIARQIPCSKPSHYDIVSIPCLSSQHGLRH